MHVRFKYKQKYSLFEQRIASRYNGAKGVYILTLKNNHDYPVNFKRPSGLTAAIYFLKCLSEGQSVKELSERFDNNEECILRWIDFLKYNRFIEEITSEQNIKLTISPIGKMWLRRYEFALK